MNVARFFVAAALCMLAAQPLHAEESTADVIKALGLREDAKPVSEMKYWQKPKKMVVVVDTPERLAWYQEVVKGVTLMPVRTAKDAAPEMADADAFLGFCQAPLLNAAKNLKWIHSQQAGVEECLTPAVRAGGILLTNVKRVNGPNVAEHTMALLLTLTRQINVALANQAKGEWNGRNMRAVMDLDGKTMLIVGLGGIGTEIADL